MPVPVLHIPHSSRVIPPNVRATLLPDDASLSAELFRMTDAWTDQLVENLGLPAKRIVFPVSRLVVDVERFHDDAQEPMSTKGMGAVYTLLSTGERLRYPDAVARSSLLAHWYEPHHAKLTEAVDDGLSAEGSCLIIDMHSFSSSPLPHEPDQDPNRPEICIGTDPFHSPIADDQIAIRLCQEAGFTVRVNGPFSGSIVPEKHWGKTKEVCSLMVEVRRDLYMNEKTGERLSEFDAISARVCSLIREFVVLASETL
jgi:N-formylglutamate deformylase